ncbi:membrane protein [Besnoitia besnoiti]|uniref:Membrane protein n=1 Tax=Besnoitia besnoiti TaxID=94643 RepID=A0A2A9MKM0_BESBE|nr:membrane protein [Besnoitia besnoiti]PFH35980.1 membrane protein [Besnoitia besnoiti]
MRSCTFLALFYCSVAALASGTATEPYATFPVCDVAVESALCLHGAQKVLLPNAQPFGLELHITFDSVRPLDDSGKKNHASGEVMAAAGIGGSGSSGLFRRNYVYVPSTEGLQTADFSYTMFAYLLEDAESRANNELHDQYCPLIHKGIMKENVQEAAPAILIDPRDGRIKVVVATSQSHETPGEEMMSNSRMKPHQWYHIAVIRRMNRVFLYVDGILDSSMVTHGLTRTNDLPLYIGSAPYAEDVCDMPLLIDELKAYSYALGRDNIQAEASIALAGVEPSFIHIGCVDCNKEEAASACPDGYHLCDKLELYSGGYQVARKLSLGTSLVAAGSATPAKGTALCCSDA